jgi:hypothetical protein
VSPRQSNVLFPILCLGHYTPHRVLQLSVSPHPNRQR